MSYLQIALLLMHPWLHDYTEWKHWHNKYDKIYEQSIKKYGLDKRGVTLHFYRAVAIIESHQVPKLRGGGGRAFWGLFQISRQLAKRYGVPRYSLFDPTVNTRVFSKWLKDVIKIVAPKTTGVPYGLSGEEWWRILYASHNNGPTPMARYIKRKNRWQLLGRWIARVRGAKDAKYRSSLFQLIPELVKISRLGTLSGGRSKVGWWLFRERYMYRCGYTRPKRYKWRARTRFLRRWQKKGGLPQTGVWDTVTETAMLKLCRRSHVKTAKKKNRKGKPNS